LEAAELFTLVLETGQIYDPELRLESLQCLQKLFKSNSELGCDQSKILQQINKFTPVQNNILFLVNISASMEGVKIENA